MENQIVEETSLWRETSDSWECPGCKRKKHECEVTTKEGKILRKIVIHHDHMHDYANFYIKNVGWEWNDLHNRNKFPNEFHGFWQMIKSFSVRFQPTKVCLCCNEIEGVVKNRILADKFFSFEISEISRAIKPVPYEKHKLIDENMDFFRLLYGKVFDRLVFKRKKVIESLIDNSIYGDVLWGRIQLDKVLDEDVLYREYPEFTSKKKIEEDLANGICARLGAKWTESEEEELIASFKLNPSLEDISKAHGRTVKAITMRLIKLGLLEEDASK